MKASEVLKRYAEEKRDFQHVNLRGQSFKDQNLSGADFSEADLRSTNFTNANLEGANFTGAKCGLQKRWVVILVTICFFMGVTSHFFSYFASDSIVNVFNSSQPYKQIASWINVFIIILFLIASFKRGIVNGLFTITGTTSLVVILVVMIFIIIGTSAGLVAMIQSILEVISEASSLSEVETKINSIDSETFAGIASKAAKDFFAIFLPGEIALDVALTEIYVIAAIFFATLSISIALLVWYYAVLGVVASAFIDPQIFSVVAILSGAYFGWRIFKNDEKDAWFISLSITIAAIWGTSFRDAILTNANFSQAKVKNTDFRKANLINVRWYQCRMIDSVRAGKTYLKEKQTRKWLIGEGTNKNFDGQNLKGVNFQGADLTNASFINANLGEANLGEANLSGAKLVQTQLDRTDFTGATLTGACIEDWGITTHTKLDDVKCKYIFMRLPTEEDENRRRKPDNWEENFEDDDFADFIKPIFDTLDLYHNQGVDPRAIAISWKELAEKNPDAQLQFASMEVKGEDNLLLRLQTAPNADLSQLSADYFETYNQLKALAEAESKKLIVEKDDRIQALENMLKTAIETPKFYRNVTVEQGNYNEKIEGNYSEQE